MSFPVYGRTLRRSDFSIGAPFGSNTKMAAPKQPFDVVVVGSCMTDLVRYVHGVHGWLELSVTTSDSPVILRAFFLVMYLGFLKRAKPFMVRNFLWDSAEKEQISALWRLVLEQKLP